MRHLINWMLAFQPEDRPSIPFILNHAWMKRNRERKEPTSKQSSWIKSHKKRKETAEIKPYSEPCTESTIQVQPSNKENKKEISFWKSIIEKAKSHTKVLSYEDVSNKPMFHHLRSRVYFAMSSKKKEPIKKVIEEVLKGIPQSCHNSGKI